MSGFVCRIGLALAILISFSGNSLNGKNGFQDGQLLVANPNMADPRFFKSVIYICRHDSSGALGFILNKPAGRLARSLLMKSLGMETSHLKDIGDVAVRFGGPLEPNSIFLMYPEQDTREENICERDGIAVTNDKETLKMLVSKKSTEELVLFMGYAGWFSGQLENELRRSDWITVPADQSILFDKDHKTLWTRARARQGINL